MSDADLNDAELEAIRAAARARSELDATEGAFDTVRLEMLEAIAATGLDEQANRERLYMGVNVLERVRTLLRMAVTGGDLARHRAEVRAILAGEPAA